MFQLKPMISKRVAFIVTLVVFGSITPSRALQFPCEFATSYCCTERMQSDCKAQCRNVNCENGGRENLVVGPKRTPAPATRPPEPSRTTAVQQAAQATENCGKSPDYKPCVPLDKANERILACCKRKGLNSCLDMCKYQVDAGLVRTNILSRKCSISLLEPFLECASERQDNRKCCYDKSIIQRTGPQCAPFCDPASGLGKLGLQHLSCSNAIASIMDCHHASIR